MTLPQDSSISKGVVLPISFRGRSAGSYIDIPRLDGSKMSLIRNLPVALFNSMIRPFPWDPGSWPKHILFLETFGLICLVIFAIRHRRTMTNREKALILCLLIFCICLASLIGWVTPVLGAIVRYRLPIHIAIIIVGLTLIRNGKKAIE